MHTLLSPRPVFDVLTPGLQIVNGCTHQKCRFCSIFTGVDFTMAPWEHIIEDIEEIDATNGPLSKRRIFLTGGNPYSLNNQSLKKVLDAVRERIPEVKEFGGFCRAADIKKRSDEELAELASFGVNMIAIGAESGYDPALEHMCKGHTGQELVEVGERLHKAGIEFSYNYVTGFAGAGKGTENAIASAQVYSAARPKYIMVFTLTPAIGCSLLQDIQDGSWQMPAEDEMAWEIRTFLEHLECETFFNCSHETDIIQFDALLPKDKENALKLLDHRIPVMRPDAARKMRRLMGKSQF